MNEPCVHEAAGEVMSPVAERVRRAREQQELLDRVERERNERAVAQLLLLTGSPEQRKTLEQLIAEQQGDDTHYVSTESDSVSLGAVWESDTGRTGADFVGVEGSDVRSYAPRFGPVWDEATIVAKGPVACSVEGPMYGQAYPHPFRKTTQFSDAYGAKWRTTTRAVPILAKLFELIMTAVGADAARAVTRKRGKPTLFDARTRSLMALAVQTFLEMGYAPSTIARSLSLPRATVTRYARHELPVLSPEAHARIFGGSPATSSDEIQPSSETDAARGRSDDPAPASPNVFPTHQIRRRFSASDDHAVPDPDDHAASR